MILANGDVAEVEQESDGTELKIEIRKQRTWNFEKCDGDGKERDWTVARGRRGWKCFFQKRGERNVLV